MKVIGLAVLSMALVTGCAAKKGQNNKSNVISVANGDVAAKSANKDYSADKYPLPRVSITQIKESKIEWRWAQENAHPDENIGSIRYVPSTTDDKKLWQERLHHLIMDYVINQSEEKNAGDLDEDIFLVGRWSYGMWWDRQQTFEARGHNALKNKAKLSVVLALQMDNVDRVQQVENFKFEFAFHNGKTGVLENALPPLVGNGKVTSTLGILQKIKKENVIRTTPEVEIEMSGLPEEDLRRQLVNQTDLALIVKDFDITYDNGEVVKYSQLKKNAKENAARLILVDHLGEVSTHYVTSQLKIKEYLEQNWGERLAFEEGTGKIKRWGVVESDNNSGEWAIGGEARNGLEKFLPGKTYIIAYVPNYADHLYFSKPSEVLMQNTVMTTDGDLLIDNVKEGDVLTIYISGVRVHPVYLNFSARVWYDNQSQECSFNFRKYEGATSQETINFNSNELTQKRIGIVGKELFDLGTPNYYLQNGGSSITVRTVVSGAELNGGNRLSLRVAERNNSPATMLGCLPASKEDCCPGCAWNKDFGVVDRVHGLGSAVKCNDQTTHSIPIDEKYWITIVKN